jgi:hypothetical protein
MEETPTLPLNCIGAWKYKKGSHVEYHWSQVAVKRRGLIGRRFRGCQAGSAVVTQPQQQGALKLSCVVNNKLSLTFLFVHDSSLSSLFSLSSSPFIHFNSQVSTAINARIYHLNPTVTV